MPGQHGPAAACGAGPRSGPSTESIPGKSPHQYRPIAQPKSIPGRPRLWEFVLYQDAAVIIPQVWLLAAAAAQRRRAGQSRELRAARAARRGAGSKQGRARCRARAAAGVQEWACLSGLSAIFTRLLAKGPAARKVCRGCCPLSPPLPSVPAAAPPPGELALCRPCCRAAASMAWNALVGPPSALSSLPLLLPCPAADGCCGGCSCCRSSCCCPPSPCCSSPAASAVGECRRTVPAPAAFS